MQMSVQRRPTSLLAMLIVIVAAGCGLLATETGNWEKTVQAATVPSAAGTSNGRDFDFLVGSWEVSNRRLKVRNVGSTDWDEFPGYQVMRTVLGGIGNVDEIEFPSKGWSGMTLRLFNPQTRQWTIYWVNSRDGIMQAPVVGTFNRGVGEFFGEDIDDGKPVRVRYIWSDVTENAARWEQAFSLNGCKTWETNWIMELSRSGAIETTPGRIQETVSLDHPRACCPVVELRQYTLYPGKRDTLIEVFDREFVESQEQLGMRVIGQFRDMDKPNRFVWLRGFGDFSVRANEFQSFYGGPVWAAHRAVANATMLDASNVLLLRPARAVSGFQVQGRERAPPGATELSRAMIVATIYYFDAPVTQDFIEFFERTIMPAMSRAGAPVATYFVTESRANEFPVLPVREGENVFVWFATFKSVGAYQNHLAQLDGSREWRDKIWVDLRRKLQSNPEILRLAPTARSLLSG